MLYGTAAGSTPAGEREPWALVPLGFCIVIAVVLGLTLPSPVVRLLNQVVEIATP
jgi:hypothetical protein